MRCIATATEMSAGPRTETMRSTSIYVTTIDINVQEQQHCTQPGLIHNRHTNNIEAQWTRNSPKLRLLFFNRGREDAMGKKEKDDKKSV
jgi:hypothetical protein